MPNHSSPSYTLRRSARAKRTRIVVTADKIEVVAPLKVSESKIQAFVKSQQDWIRQAMARVSQRTPATVGLAPADYVEAAEIPYRGERIPLTIKASSGRSPRIQLLPSRQLAVYLPVSHHASAHSDVIRQALERWMKQQARVEALLLIEKHAARLTLKPRSLKIKTQKSRWGSCGPHNDINLNWLLMLAPPIVMEYVVLHELCHIRHKNHSRDFWSLVAEHMPDYLQHRHWLKQHGASLMRGL